MMRARSERGVVLLVVLVLLSSLSLLAAMNSHSAATEWQLVGNHQHGVAARQRAEQALAAAVGAWMDLASAEGLSNLEQHLADVAAATTQPGDALAVTLAFSGCYPRGEPADDSPTLRTVARYRLDLALTAADGSRYDLQRILDTPDEAASCVTPG